MTSWIKSPGLGDVASSSNKDLRPLLRKLRELGIRTENTRKGHIKVYAPLGLYIMSGTPSDYRAIRNIISNLRRLGVAW